MYKHIRNLSCSTRQFPPKISCGSRSAELDLDQANLFNDYFYSIFTDPDKEVANNFSHVEAPPSLEHVEFNACDVYNELVRLDHSKAAGIDNIGPWILKHCALGVYEPLHHIFNLSLSSHSLPTEWYTHLIVPIYKNNGDRSLVNNYRPISLLCSVSKVLERLIFDRIIDHILPHINSTQFGFVKNRSSVKQLLTFLDTAYSALNERKSVDVIYFDIKKAFDSVQHNTLLCKLKSFEISGGLWKWKQHVRIGNVKSSPLLVLSGVPQGSFLGPLLFIIYINDLSNCLLSPTLSFADDTKMYRVIRTTNDNHIIQSDLQSIAKSKASK